MNEELGKWRSTNKNSKIAMLILYKEKNTKQKQNSLKEIIAKKVLIISYILRCSRTFCRLTLIIAL